LILRYHNILTGNPELVWFETLLDEDDVDIAAWALKNEVPDHVAAELRSWDLMA
jgi:antitoxin CptB